ncbi:MAG: cytidine deaminase [Ignavibacteriaceae bacterium]|jgi:cytidine deaminase|nr:cytidine deaminase [Ignavibacteriaceae bacterium]
MDYKHLAESAIKAKKNALPLYSNFYVGAAVLTKENKVYSGCNVESSSYSLTICAERNAIFKAISEGEREFKAIAVAGDTEDYISPCGACRQVISDLCGDIDIIMVNSAGDYIVKKTSELLPFAFGDQDFE